MNFTSNVEGSDFGLTELKEITMKVIKVLGSGGPRCIETFKVVETAIKESGVAASLERVSNHAEILKFGFVTTPALVFDGTIKVMNRVPTTDEVVAWLRE